MLPTFGRYLQKMHAAGTVSTRAAFSAAPSRGHLLTHLNFKKGTHFRRRAGENRWYP